jgi:hypothetical protein
MRLSLRTAPNMVVVNAVLAVGQAEPVQMKKKGEQEQ